MLNNYGDIVLAPGEFNLYGTLKNVEDPDSQDDYKGHLYYCAVDEAVVPITPTTEQPLIVEERIELDPPAESTIMIDDGATIVGEDLIVEATVEVTGNGELGDLTPAAG